MVDVRHDRDVPEWVKGLHGPLEADWDQRSTRRSGTLRQRRAGGRPCPGHVRLRRGAWPPREGAAISRSTARATPASGHAPSTRDGARPSGAASPLDEPVHQEPLVRARSGHTVGEAHDPAASTRGWHRGTVTPSVQGDGCPRDVERRVSDADSYAGPIGGEEDEQARCPTCGLHRAGRANGRRGPSKPRSQ